MFRTPMLLTLSLTSFNDFNKFHTDNRSRWDIDFLFILYQSVINKLEAWLNHTLLLSHKCRDNAQILIN